MLCHNGWMKSKKKQLQVFLFVQKAQKLYDNYIVKLVSHIMKKHPQNV